MGILDELKKKAQSLSQSKAEDAARLRGNVEQVEGALDKSFRYLDEFGKHMQVIAPPSAHSFVLEGVGSFDGLALTDFFTDYPKKKFEDKEYFDLVLFRYRQFADRALAVKKDAGLSRHDQRRRRLREGTDDLYPEKRRALRDAEASLRRGRRRRPAPRSARQIAPR